MSQVGAESLAAGACSRCTFVDCCCSRAALLTNSLTLMCRYRRLDCIRGIMAAVQVFLSTLLHKVMLGNWKPKSSWHCLTIATLLVLNNFVKKRSRTKSSDLRSDLFVGHASNPYNRAGIHLLWISCKVVSSEADLPILQKNAVSCVIKRTFCSFKRAFKLKWAHNEYAKISHYTNPWNRLTRQCQNLGTINMISWNYS